jgi:hypothetical protein
MEEKEKIKLASEIRETIKSLNIKIREAHRNRIMVVVTQECGPYSRLSSEPDLVMVEIREENIL